MKGNSLNEDEFKLFIQEAIENRKEYIFKKRSVKIEVDPRIADSVSRSTMISSKQILIIIYSASKGRSHLLIRGKSNMRKEREVDYKDQREMLDKAKEEIKSLKVEIENMRKELTIKDVVNVEQDKYADF